MSTQKIVPLNKNTHAKLKIKSTANFSHVAQQHLIPVVVQEFIPVSSSFPIIFVKESAESENFVPVALMGLTKGENLYVNSERYDEIYVPAALRNYPLSIAGDEEKGQFFVCIDESSELVNEDEGTALFNDDGSETEYLQKRRDFTGKFIENMQTTKSFMKFLQDNELLVSNDLTVKIDSGETFNLNGIFRVDEEKLAGLDEAKFEDMRKRGALPAIYAHLNSLQQVQRVAKRKAAATA
ncbi:SapC family protein [Bowmanella sp. JS7-9]|uniref:SapC family protein n=1 Tax=Pseudobowmanella zhangzhouensis TaxID=1537679 RepID=A0ABW1XJ40_9ALTE|nr:SapC family protein [Bowmanella sp. JS7-9]TBX26020.1 hypothetical protein TK45_02090 [Bowmanella sp. JS7-9]